MEKNDEDDGYSHQFATKAGDIGEFDVLDAHILRGVNLEFRKWKGRIFYFKMSEVVCYFSTIFFMIAGHMAAKSRLAVM